jgi:ABC-type nitrate/sulfonate/bicarbonate transport system ATPase subunit
MTDPPRAFATAQPGGRAGASPAPGAAARPVKLAAVDVAYVYTGGRDTRALHDLTLEVRDNEFLAVVGPVGCGKTTFLRLAAGFLAPTHGTIVCDGAPVAGPSPARGYVFQENAIFPWMTVRDNIEFGLVARATPPARRRATSDELLARIGLESFADAYPGALSAGMSKMVEVARVLATDPSILLLDEPFGALDAHTRARMQGELHRLWDERRKTVIMVTHDVDEAIYLADRIVVFSRRPGRVQADIPVDLPRPRPLEMRLGADFAAVKVRVWTQLGLGESAHTPSPP